MEDEKELYDLNQLESNFNKVTGKDILMLNQDQIDVHSVQTLEMHDHVNPVQVGD